MIHEICLISGHIPERCLIYTNSIGCAPHTPQYYYTLPATLPTGKQIGGCQPYPSDRCPLDDNPFETEEECRALCIGL